MGEVMALLMFAAALLAAMIGFPVAFSLAGLALLFAGVGALCGLFDPALLAGLGPRYLGVMTNETLVAVPLFVFMGLMLEKSNIARQLLEAAGALFGPMRGGLGISVILVGALLAASTGIVGATVVTMGLISLPVMARAGYDPRLSSGIICASGTLGQIIPPSTVLIFLGDLLQTANQQAQLARGQFAPEPLSVGQLFAGALLPGLMLAGLYILWTLLKAVFDPASCPAMPPCADEPRQGRTRRAITAMLPPLALIVAVLGSIMAGVASPTESASVGAVGALVLAALRGQFNLTMLRATCEGTLSITAMIFALLLGASAFSLVFRGLGGEALIDHILSSMPGGMWMAFLLVMAVIFALGFFLDTFEIIFIITPIAAPALIKLGMDPLWLGVAIALNLQTSFLTPPFGFSLFYLRGVAGSFCRTADIYRGIVPFVGLQLVAIALLVGYPSLATWLPDKLFGAPLVAEVPQERSGGVEERSDGAVADEGERFDDLFLPVERQRPVGERDERFDDLFPARPKSPP
jgi:tripartite ATP-independent transporter DctM subunit